LATLDIISQHSRPEDFSGKPNKDVRIKLLNVFESQCAMIENYSSSRAKDLTLYEFISRIEYIKEKMKFDAKMGVRL
jgi:hypothetical protein